jgi:hypothetical protein
VSDRPAIEPEAILEARRARRGGQRQMGRVVLLSNADLQLLSILRPTCQKCGKPVDGFAWRYEGTGMTFKAHCHGQVETTSLGISQVQELLRSAVRGGTAFGGPDKLTGPRPLLEGPET